MGDWEERVSLGLEQRLWIFVFRGGVAKGTDGLQAVSAGLGLWLGPVHFDLSAGLMSGGFDFLTQGTPAEPIDYAGGQLTFSFSIQGGGR